MDQRSARGLSAYLKELRRERRLSQRGLAAKAGLSSGVMSRVESGHRQPQPDTLKALAEALDVPLADLFAVAGYVYDLPSMDAYLRAKYGALPEKTLTEIDSYVTKIVDEHGLELYGPVHREDELPINRTVIDGRDGD